MPDQTIRSPSDQWPGPNGGRFHLSAGTRQRAVDLIPTRSASEAETAKFLAGASGWYDDEPQESLTQQTASALGLVGIATNGAPLGPGLWHALCVSTKAESIELTLRGPDLEAQARSLVLTVVGRSVAGNSLSRIRPGSHRRPFVGRPQEGAVIMIMAANAQEYLQTRGLLPETVRHLQRLVLLNVDSRNAYRAAALLAKDARLIALAEHTDLERQSQAVTLQIILWGDGTESTSRMCIETGDHGLLDRVKASPETSLTTIIQRLLDIDDYVYSCYEKVLSTIQGRGIRQLLSEQAARIEELRTTLTELKSSLDVS